MNKTGKKISNDAALVKLRKVLGDPAPEVTENYVRIRQKSPGQYVRMRTIWISKSKGIKAVIGFKRGGGSEVQSYLFDKKKWTIATAKKWIAAHKGDSIGDTILLERLMDIDPDKQRDVFLADAIKVDAWTETPAGITFHDVVFAKEGVQKYHDGMHYKPADALKAALESFRGKPVVAYQHPPDKIVTRMAQQIGHIVFDKVKWDKKGKRPYGDVFVKKEKKNEEIIDAIKKKKLQDNSIGFRCDILNKAGEFNGIHYDKVQENFFIDHLALVMQGRSTGQEGVGINAF